MIDVHDGRELLKSYVAVTVAVGQSKDTIGQEWVGSLTQEAEKYSKLF